MDNKPCFKCGQTKPLTDFYKHPGMADGHLGKCKNCTKQDTENWRAIKSTDPIWLESEYQRHREKARKYRELGIGFSKRTPEDQRRARLRDPEKYKARHKLSNAIRDGRIQRLPCVICGDHNSQGHHEDYYRPLDVVWLCVTHHNQRHNAIRRAERLRALLQTNP